MLALPPEKLDINLAYRQTLACLDKLYSYLNCLFFNNKLPVVLITTEFQPEHQKMIKAYFQSKSPFCAYNMNLSRIKMSPRYFKNANWVALALLLVHEMLHLYARNHQVFDYDHKECLHTAAFKELAEQHGLIVLPPDGHGYSQLAFKESSKKLIEDFCKDMPLPSIIAE